MPEYDLTTAEGHPDHGPVVIGDRPCTSCGYNLSGLPVSGVCPECGQPVQRSLLGELLQFASPSYVKQVDSGLWIILAAIIAYVLLIVLRVTLIAAFINGKNAAGFTGASVEILTQGLSLLPSVLFILGYWKYTTPDPGFTGREKPNSARMVARIAACVQPAAKLGVVVAQLLGASTPRVGSFGANLVDLAAGIFHLADLAAYATLFFAIILYTRWIAFRVPDSDIIKETRSYIWLIPVLSTVGMILCGLGPLIALILYFNLLVAVRRRTQQALRFQELAAEVARFRAIPPPQPRFDAPP